MKVPVGFMPKLWSFLSFLPYFFLLLTLGLLKGVIIGPVVVAIIVISNSAVIIGLWPAHFIWTLYCVLRTKRLGPFFKMVMLVALPVPLILWPIVGIAGSVLGGIGYGFFAPLIATFEAVGENVADKCYHCFVVSFSAFVPLLVALEAEFFDGVILTPQSRMANLIDKSSMGNENKKITQLSNYPFESAGCLAFVLDNLPLISSVVLSRTRPSPLAFLFPSKFTCSDIELSIPIRNNCSRHAIPNQCIQLFIITSHSISNKHKFIGAKVFAIYENIIKINNYELSGRIGFTLISILVLYFYCHVNHTLQLVDRSTFRFRMENRDPTPIEKVRTLDFTDLCFHSYFSYMDELSEKVPEDEKPVDISCILVSLIGRLLEDLIGREGPDIVWDWLFKSCEVNGRILLRDGFIDIKDIEECIINGNCKKLGIKLPAWVILQCLLVSAKSNSPGLVISDDLELTRINSPRDKVFEWFIGPLLIMKEQIKKLQLDDNQEICLRELIMRGKSEKPEDWDDSGFLSGDNIKKAQLQAIIRRLQGIVASVSRVPTFWRRFRNLVKLLYIEALQAGASSNHIGGILKSRFQTRVSSFLSYMFEEDHIYIPNGKN
ncbi:hypothetical protein JRO89_XS01G0114200 [Xanthoceras sorbifolium]|uniref:Uncharacterized protein n=1 Tax=Xanthoceras sorbifolium TaxID=99658 RepID=A0ABQ8IIU5_9ROSI|nr:hypothetical protein JRO89_XS01G0114200 [Xanthoceras sorbifolium]